MTRRQLFGGLAASQAAGAQAGWRRPNVVYILTDDQRWDLLSLRGHPYLKTPNMDRIGREGAVFANSFVTTSLCSPSRASFLTGRYASQHGVLTNAGSAAFDKTERTFPYLLRSAGYATAYAGKWHLGDNSEPRPGFDRWAVFPGQGRYTNPEVNVDGSMVEMAGHADHVVSNLAVDFLRQRPKEKPFCLCMGIKSPHADFTPPLHLKTLFENERIVPPRSMFEDYHRGGKSSVTAKHCFVAEGSRALGFKGGVYEDFIKDFHRCIASADEAVGAVLGELDAQGLTEDTVVVFAGDNGYFLGEHGLIDKRFPYEEGLRIPLLIRYPRKISPGTVIQNMSLNIDACPTILEYCGVDIPSNVSGRSLARLAMGKHAPEWRNDFFYEYHERTLGVPAMTAVRTERFKYIQYLENSETDEMYDLLLDGHEMRNVVSDNHYANAREDLQRRLRDWKAAIEWRKPALDPPLRPCRS